MVALANRMQQKLARGASNTDEDAKFRAYMLSLGIPIPVTKVIAAVLMAFASRSLVM